MDIKIPNATKVGYLLCQEGGVFDIAYPSSKNRRGRVQGEKGNICPALATTAQPVRYEGITLKLNQKAMNEIEQLKQRLKEIADAILNLQNESKSINDKIASLETEEKPKERKFRIRKLTPKECFRLMGVGDKWIEILLNSGISNSQLYKLAGNSIVAGTGTTDENGHKDGAMYHLFRKMFNDLGREQDGSIDAMWTKKEEMQTMK